MLFYLGFGCWSARGFNVLMVEFLFLFSLYMSDFTFKLIENSTCITKKMYAREKNIHGVDKSKRCQWVLRVCFRLPLAIFLVSFIIALLVLISRQVIEPLFLIS